MKNIYLIISNNSVAIELNIKKIKEKYKDYIQISYDLENTLIDDVIENLDTYNFLENNKFIIGNHSTFLGTDKTGLDHNLEKLLKYCENPNPDNILVLVTDKTNKKIKHVSKILDLVEIIEPVVSSDDIIKNNLDGYKMDKKAINLLIEYCNHDDERMVSELNKLKIYKFDEKEILDIDIKDIVKKNLDDNIYTLIDDILNGNKKEAFELYNDMLLHGEQVSEIITKLANKIRLIYQVKVLTNDGKSEAEIAKLYNSHPYPIKLAHKSSINYSENMLLEYLSRLAKLDYDIKTGNGNPQVVFETFIAEI